jgi:hypothetical protein
VQQGVNVFTALPVKNNLFDLNDRLLFLFGADTANTTNSVAQTASITAVNLFQNSSLILAANTISAQTVTANSFVANTIQANSYNMFLGQPLLSTNFSFNANQIANCHANVITIVSAQGANTIICPIFVVTYATVGNPWTVDGTTGFFLGNDANLSGSPLDNNAMSQVLQANAGVIATTCYLSGKLSTANDVNQPLNLASASVAPTSGNLSISGTLQYIVLENVPNQS